MMMRGIKKERTVTITTATRGLPDKVEKFEEKVLRIIKREKKHDKKD